MLKFILFGIFMGLLGMFLGVKLIKKNIINLNNSFRIPKDLPLTFEEYKERIIKYIDIDYIMDVCFSYGFKEKYIHYSNKDRLDD